MANFFGTDGIRLHEEEFTRDFLARVLSGLISYHGSTNFRLLIGGDTRPSTARISNDLLSLCDERGITVDNLGIFPTPAINFCLGALGYDFAIDITASHNPATYNGLKIFELQDGKPVKLTAKGRECLEAALARDVAHNNASAMRSYPQATAEDKADLTRNDGPSERHTPSGIAAYSAHLVHPNLSGLRLLLDCANGAMSSVAPDIFKNTGADVTPVNVATTYTDQINAHCGSTDLRNLQAAVKQGDYDLAIAYDGDGDRCLLLDNTGALVDGDKILALLADFLGQNTIVTTVMAGQGLFAWAEQHGKTLEITDVGDQNVFARMQEKGLSLGGEQSGHIILPGEPMGDGLLTSLTICQMLSTYFSTEKSTENPDFSTKSAKKSTTFPQVIHNYGELFHKLSTEIPTFPQVSTSVPATKAQKSALKTPEIQQLLATYTEKLQAAHGRLLVRPSGTEDLIRITLWGDREDTIDALATELSTKLKEALK